MAGIDAFIGQLVNMELRTMRTSPGIAAAMGRAFHDRLSVTLRTYSHPMYTLTTSPRGNPPAFVSGELLYSVTMRSSGGPSTSRAWIGPHTVYAAVQEFGRDDIRPTSHRYMRWYMEGTWWYKKSVDVPARPYMRPTRDEMIADGSLQRAAVEAFLAGW